MVVIRQEDKKGFKGGVSAVVIIGLICGAAGLIINGLRDDN